MRKIKRDFVSAILFYGLFAWIVSATPLWSQISNPGVQQSGAVTFGHAATWGPGVGQIQDGGGAFSCAGIGGGTACLANTGTIGHAVPFLDGSNTWDAASTQTFPDASTWN